MVESSAPGNEDSNPPAPIQSSEPAESGFSIEDRAADPEPTLEPWTLAAPETSAEPPPYEPAAPSTPEPPVPAPSFQVTPPAEPAVEAIASEPTPAEGSPTPLTASDPTFLSSIEVPSSPTAETSGGEWELLLSKIQQWLESGELQATLQSIRSPLLALGAVVALVLVLRVYGALLGAIDSLPLVGGLLELTGVIWLTRFGATNLVRSSDRQKLLSSAQERWRAFLGRR